MSDLICPACRGTGDGCAYHGQHESEHVPCSNCGGRGTVTSPGATEREWLEGLREESCMFCGGSGLNPGRLAMAARAIANVGPDRGFEEYAAAAVRAFHSTKTSEQ